MVVLRWRLPYQPSSACAFGVAQRLSAAQHVACVHRSFETASECRKVRLHEPHGALVCHGVCFEIGTASLRGRLIDRPQEGRRESMGDMEKPGHARRARRACPLAALCDIRGRHYVTSATQRCPVLWDCCALYLDTSQIMRYPPTRFGTGRQRRSVRAAGGIL